MSELRGVIPGGSSGKYPVFKWVLNILVRNCGEGFSWFASVLRFAVVDELYAWKSS